MAPPTGAIPPELPPTVEEAYRRKCIELKRRLNEVEEANDQQRIRVTRARRGITKLRLERAFLLEQLAKRTSTNVEDSEGSPSPPPSPKEKPLRTKRGHRKPDFLTTDMGDGRIGSTFIQQGPVTISPSSDAFSHTAFSHTHPDPLRNSTPQAQVASSAKRLLLSNGNHVAAGSSSTSARAQPRIIKNAFEFYCEETKYALAHKNNQGIMEHTYNLDDGLARGWASLDAEKKEYYSQQFERMKEADIKREAEAQVAAQPSVASAMEYGESTGEDTEMRDGADTPGGGADAGGFTAVNRG